MTRFSAFFYSTSAIVALVTSASPVLAQTSAVSAETAEKLKGLADIIVTATRSGATNLQSTPIAVTAFSGQALAERGVGSALDLNGLAPNVSIGGRAGAGATQGNITIRGIGVDANPPAQPGVGIYVDDVYVAAQFGNLLGAYDLGQIEILRGPAGTSFGRNTIGGAVQYTSVKPKIGELSGFAEVTGGNHQHFDIAGGINLPIADWAALRVSGARTSIDGYVFNIRNGENRGSADNSDIRVQLLLKPSEDLSINIKAEQVKQESNGPAATQIGFNPLRVGSVPASYVSPDYYTSAGTDAPVSFNGKIQILQGAIRYNLTSDIWLKSITAYSESTNDLQLDADGTPGAYFATNQGENVNKLFTQELQLAGQSFGGNLHWSLGAYYYNEKSTRVNTSASVNGAPFSNGTFGDYEVKTKSYAGYGQLTYDLTQQLSLVAGLRYTDESNDVLEMPGFGSPATYRAFIGGPVAVFNPFLPTVLTPIVAFQSSSSSNNWSPLVGFNFQATSDILLYAKWSRGFRGSGFSPTLYGPSPFNPETAETYEVGTRMEFFDRRVRINPTIFLTNWTNIQFNDQVFFGTTTFPPGTPAVAPIVRNAGNARAKGAEIETQFRVTEHLTLTANGALFDGKYTFISPGIRVTSASELSRAPKSSFSVGGRYELPVGNAGKFVLNGNYVWQADQRAVTSDLTNAGVGIEAYGLLNARLAYIAANNAFSISLYSNNLTNTKYAIGGVNFAGSPNPTIERDVGRPREFGLTARVNFK